MQNNTDFLNEKDKCIRFDLLPEYITTVNNILEYIDITETDKYGDTITDEYWTPQTITAIKALAPIHAYNDDLFDAKNNKIVENTDIDNLYNLGIL